jgi:hypothetical protein
MDITTSELVKTLTGKGEVYEDGTKICNASYKLRIRQEFIITERKEKVEGHQETKGTISGCDIYLLLEKEKLTLHLNDGKRLDFFVKNERGVIYATGGLYGS